MRWGFANHLDQVNFLINSVTNISLKIYNLVSEKFLPLPKKSHYLFNFRDLMKVLQGLLAVPSAKYDALDDNRKKVLKLWVHENLCVYSDRLVDEQDKKEFFNVLSEAIYDEYQLPIYDIFDRDEAYDQVIFGNFMETHSF